MEISKKQLILTLAGLSIIVLLLGGFWRSAGKVQTLPAPAAKQAATSSAAFLDNATSSEKTSVAAVRPFPINAADTISSWTFKGQYAGSDILVTQANADIVHLASLLGKGQYDDYDLYDGLANDYAMIGAGKLAYQNYNFAIHIYPNKGLAYVNLAHLMDEMKAYHTAADAYAKAVAVEPGMLEYHVEQLTFLTGQFPNDNAMVTAAFADASKQFGDTSAVLQIEAQWLTGQKRYADAIEAWETVKTLSPADRQAAIDAEIARLKAKQ